MIFYYLYCAALITYIYVTYGYRKIILKIPLLLLLLLLLYITTLHSIIIIISYYCIQIKIIIEKDLTLLYI